MNIQQAIWTEKYRPETLDDIIGHEPVVERLKDYVDDDEVPHMLFGGPPGVGKTAAITAFAREVFGDDWRNNFDELNASDERGIDVIRDKVKGIARSSPAGDAQFTILFLDEADQLTTEAQASLRRIMEQYSDVTRFAFSCNYQNQIIDAIQSRCAVFRFGRLSNDEMRDLLSRVIEGEDIDVEDGYLVDRIIVESRGDARSAINMLQSAVSNGELTKESVDAISSSVNQSEVEDIVELAISGELDDAMQRLDNQLLKKGVDTQTIADEFLWTIKTKDIPAPGKAKIIDKLAETEYRVLTGANPNVQFHSFIADICVGYHLTLNKYGGDAGE